MNLSPEAVLKDKISVITGASSGIGRACAHLLFRYQSKVVLVDINQDNLDQTVAEMATFGSIDNLLSLKLNVRSEADMTKMANQTLERFGRLDHLIASAGILRLGGSLKTTIETPFEEWKAIIETNLTGTFLSNRAVLSAMIAQKQGDIINISSVSGRVGRAFDAPYCASKFGIIGFSESLAEEVAGYGIRVQTILPDSVDTPFWEQNGSRSIKAPVTIPAERVAEMIIYLLILPRDAFLLNPIIGPFKSRRRREKKST